jgi:hypothetical protein
MIFREPLVRKLLELEQGRPRHAFVRADAIADLELRALEAQAWCAQHLVMNAVDVCLRRADIAPHLLAGDRWQVVDSVVTRRRQALALNSSPLASHYDGRFLVYFPDAELGTSSSEDASNGFFDPHGAPPWGTWVGYFEEPSEHTSYANYLLAWVPSELESLAAAGIEATPDECIRWLHECSVEVRCVVAAFHSEARANEHSCPERAPH